jgi:hypothetical protein
MNVLEGLDGSGNRRMRSRFSRWVSKEDSPTTSATVTPSIRSTGKRSSVRSTGKRSSIRSTVKRSPSPAPKSSPSPMTPMTHPDMPAPAAGPNIGTIVLVGGALVGVAGLAYFLLR